MAYTPLYVGETHRALSLTWLDDTGTALNLSGATITVEFSKTGATTASFAGTGTPTITNAVSGLFTYTFAAADLAAAGNYLVQFKADYGSSSFQYSDPLPLQILPVLS